MVKRQMQPTCPSTDDDDGQAKYLHVGISFSSKKSEVLIHVKHEQTFKQAKQKKPVSKEQIQQFLLWAMSRLSKATETESRLVMSGGRRSCRETGITSMGAEFHGGVMRCSKIRLCEHCRIMGTHQVHRTLCWKVVTFAGPGGTHLCPQHTEG